VQHYLQTVGHNISQDNTAKKAEYNLLPVVHIVHEYDENIDREMWIVCNSPSVDVIVKLPGREMCNTYKLLPMVHGIRPDKTT